MRIGDVGDKFYIILKGTIEVQLPNPKTQQTFRKVGADIDDQRYQLAILDQKIAEAKRTRELKL